MASSDTEDENLKLAIAISLAESEERAPKTTAVGALEPSRSVNGFAGLNRYAMEQERLARVAARKRDRSESPPPLRRLRKSPKIEPATVELPSGARLNMFTSLVQQDQAGRKADIANTANNQLKMIRDDHSIPENDKPIKGLHLSSSVLAYPHGVVKKTWAFGYERTGNDIKIEEVLEPLTLRTAVLSAFQWDMEWLLPKLRTPLNGGTTKCVFVMQGKDEAIRRELLANIEQARSFLRLVFPPMGGQVHCMHSKLMLLFHPQKLRVAIPTANLLNFDWGETGLMENTVFIIDLPRLPENEVATREELTNFGKELMFFLDKQGMDDDIKSAILHFDFCSTKDMAFVHTVGGILHGDESKRTGHPGLSRAVRQLGLETDYLEIDFAASSIGALKDEYLCMIYSAARGEDVIEQCSTAASKAKADFFKNCANRQPPDAVSIREKMRVYFPTYETVTSSNARSAGTICISRKWWEDMPFPRPVFRDYISNRTGLLSHNKIMYVRGRRKVGQKTENIAWVYVGSSNMSESAWGKLVYDKKAKVWKINCRNWECGVLLRVTAKKVEQMENLETPSNKDGTGNAAEIQSKQELVSMKVFDDLLPVPFVYPGAMYNGKEPWYFQEHSQ